MIFTDNERLSSLFEEGSLYKNINVTIRSLDKIKGNLLNNNSESYYYIDVNDLPQKEIDNLMEKIRVEKLNIGIIDPKGKIKDPASLIFKGFFDYLGKDVIKRLLQSQELDFSRIESAINFHKNRLTVSNFKKGKEKLEKEVNFCSNWKEVKEGKEYLFWILFIVVDNVDRLKESISNEYRKYLFARFKEFVRKIVKKGNGRIWIWNEHGGVVLFPYNGIDIDAIATSIRLIMNRRIFSFELKDSFDLYYRLALHRGKTIYKKRGETGTIISDDINKVFHLGLDFANRSGFYITEAAMKLLPRRAINAFEDLGIYEGLRIFKFRDFVK